MPESVLAETDASTGDTVGNSEQPMEEEQGVAGGGDDLGGLPINSEALLCPSAAPQDAAPRPEGTRRVLVRQRSQPRTRHTRSGRPAPHTAPDRLSPGESSKEGAVQQFSMEPHGNRAGAEEAGVQHGIPPYMLYHAVPQSGQPSADAWQAFFPAYAPGTVLDDPYVSHSLFEESDPQPSHPLLEYNTNVGWSMEHQLQSPPGHIATGPDTLTDAPWRQRNWLPYAVMPFMGTPAYQVQPTPGACELIASQLAPPVPATSGPLPHMPHVFSPGETSLLNIPRPFAGGHPHLLHSASMPIPTFQPLMTVPPPWNTESFFHNPPWTGPHAPVTMQGCQQSIHEQHHTSPQFCVPAYCNALHQPVNHPPPPLLCAPARFQCPHPQPHTAPPQARPWKSCQKTRQSVAQRQKTSARVYSDGGHMARNSGFMQPSEPSSSHDTIRSGQAGRPIPPATHPDRHHPATHRVRLPPPTADLFQSTGSCRVVQTE